MLRSVTALPPAPAIWLPNFKSASMELLASSVPGWSKLAWLPASDSLRPGILEVTGPKRKAGGKSLDMEATSAPNARGSY